MNHELRVKGILVTFLFFLLSALTFLLLPSPAFAALGSDCTSFLIDGKTPFDHGPLFQGRTYNFTITMLNSGDITWSPTISPTNPAEFKFGAACPHATTWGIGLCDGTGNAADSGEGSRLDRIDLTRDVPPGDSYTFNLSATTPTTAGVYLMAYMMVWEGIQWFGAACVPSLQVDDALVLPPPPPPPPGCPTMTCEYSQNVDTSICPSGSQIVTGTGCSGFNCPGCTYVGGCSEVRCSPVPPPPPSSMFDVEPAGILQLEQLFIQVVYVVVALAILAMFAFLVWAGIKYLTSGGEPKAVHAAHQTVTWALLGVIFLAIAWLILQLISAFTGIDLTIFNLRILGPTLGP